MAVRKTLQRVYFVAVSIWSPTYMWITCSELPADYNTLTTIIPIFIISSIVLGQIKAEFIRNAIVLVSHKNMFVSRQILIELRTIGPLVLGCIKHSVHWH